MLGAYGKYDWLEDNTLQLKVLSKLSYKKVWLINRARDDSMKCRVLCKKKNESGCV